MVVRVQGERCKIGSKAGSWLHSSLFIKLTANKQILSCIRKRKLWFFDSIATHGILFLREKVYASTTIVFENNFKI